MVIISLNKNKKNEDPEIFPKRKKKSLGDGAMLAIV